MNERRIGNLIKHSFNKALQFAVTLTHPVVKTLLLSKIIIIKNSLASIATLSLLKFRIVKYWVVVLGRV